MCRFSSSFLHQIRAVAAKGTTQVCTSKKGVYVTNWTRLRLSISDWSIMLIGPGGLLLVVPTYMQFQLDSFIGGVAKNKQLNLDI